MTNNFKQRENSSSLAIHSTDNSFGFGYRKNNNLESDELFIKKFDERSTCAGRTSENAGTSKTSSNVKPSENISVIDLFIAIKN